MLYFVGLGLYDLEDLTLKGLKVLKRVNKIFVETYTSLLPSFSRTRLEELCGVEVIEVSRKDLEELNGEIVLSAAAKEDVALVSPGDPFIATTHITLRLEAERRGIKTQVIHAPSVASTAISSSGLQLYKFGKCVTIVFPERRTGFLSDTPYEVLKDNLARGLHTLFLLEISVEENVYMRVSDALKLLFEMERRREYGLISNETLGIGLARLGSPQQRIKAASFARLIDEELGPPPHSLIIPGLLHPLEVEALVTLHGCKEEEIKVWERRLRELKVI